LSIVNAIQKPRRQLKALSLKLKANTKTIFCIGLWLTAYCLQLYSQLLKDMPYPDNYRDNATKAPASRPGLSS